MIESLDLWAQHGLRVGVGLVVGVLVGLERGFKLKDQPDGRRVAGVRTFSLLGLGGGIAGLLGSMGQVAVAAVLMLGAIGMLAIAYAPRLKTMGDATSPVAAVATLGIAYVAGNGLIGLALAAGAVVVLILALREELHGFVDRLDERDIKSLARFAVISLGVLPFLPNEAFGPYGAWNPFKLWWVVVLVTGFSFVGYIANRIFGARHGTIATALIGGAYSSTAVTQSLAQRLGTKEAGGAEAGRDRAGVGGDVFARARAGGGAGGPDAGAAGDHRCPGADGGVGGGMVALSTRAGRRQERPAGQPDRIASGADLPAVRGGSGGGGALGAGAIWRAGDCAIAVPDGVDGRRCVDRHRGRAARCVDRS